MTAATRVRALDWTAIAAVLEDEDHALLPGWLDDAAIEALRAGCDGDRDRADLRPPLPEPLCGWQRAFAAPLAAIAADWAARLGAVPSADGTANPGGRPSPDGEAGAGGPLASLQRIRAGAGQPLQGPEAGAGSELPLRWVALLDEPERDFSGGELILTERRPRMQSRPIVVRLRRGDAALVVVGRRPTAGSRGDYGVETKIGIGRVRSGERHGVELRFFR